MKIIQLKLIFRSVVLSICAAVAISSAATHGRENSEPSEVIAQAPGLRPVTSDSAATCACPQAPKPTLVVPIPPSAPNLVPENRGTLVASTWNTMPGWGRDNPADAWQGFLKSCGQLRSQTPWQSVCALATTLPANPSSGALIKFFEDNFVPHQVFNPDGSNNGTITGYYEPLLTGSRVATARQSVVVRNVA